jgi:hypothetical protein
MEAESERISKENDESGDDQTKVKRKLRERKKDVASDKPKNKSEVAEVSGEAEVKQDSAE